MSLSTHVLDTARGCPAAGVPVQLWREDGGTLVPLADGVTDDDGRVRALLPDGTPLSSGTYRIRFDTGAYHARLGVNGFYPDVVVRFTVRDPGAHHHVPLLISPFGFSTYRGS